MSYYIIGQWTKVQFVIIVSHTLVNLFMYFFIVGYIQMIS